MPSFLWDKARPRCSTCLIAPAEPCACPESISRTREAEQSPGGSSWPPTPPWSRGGARRGLGTASLDFALSPSQPPSPACTAPLQHPGRGSGGFLGSLFGGSVARNASSSPQVWPSTASSWALREAGQPRGPPGQLRLRSVVLQRAQHHGCGQSTPDRSPWGGRRSPCGARALVRELLWATTPSEPS